MEETKKNKGLTVVAIVLLLLIIGLIIYLLLHLNLSGEKDDIELLGDVMRVKVEEYKMMPYKISEENEKTLIFKSEDETIARIDNQGYVYGVKLGETFVTVSFEGNDNYEKKVKVIVVLEKSEGGGDEKYKGGDDPGDWKNPDDTKEEIKTDEEKKEDEKKDDPPKTTPKPICSLKVSSDGMVTATTKNAKKYSFDKKLTNNETQKKVKDIDNRQVRDYEGGKYYKVFYYVESEDNLKGSCSLIVIEKCNNGTCIYESY